MNLLSVDQGSTHCGLAYFVDDRVLWTKRLSPGKWPWGQRMRWITDRMREELAAGEAPDVIAIEDVVAHRGHPNLQSLVTMAEARGWLACALDHWYPGIRQMAIAPATVRAAVEAGRSRARAIDRYKLVAEHVTGRKVSEDEAAAVCIGLAAFARIRRDAQLTAAGIA